MPKEIKIGILYEGKRDVIPLINISKRTINYIIGGDLTIKFEPFSANGSIDGKIKPALTNFFEIKYCHFGFIVSDLDKGENDPKEKLIRDSCAKNNIKNGSLIYAFPVPEFEQWFFDEENSLKKILGLSGGEPIPFSELDPKERLKKLFKLAVQKDIVNITENDVDFFFKISEGLNIPFLKSNSKSYKKFFHEIEKMRPAFLMLLN